MPEIHALSDNCWSSANSLYRRASVNILIAETASVEEFDVKKFYDEALRIVKEMRRRALEMKWGPKTMVAIQAIEDAANQGLEEVKDIEADLIAEGKYVFPKFVPVIKYPWLRDPIEGLENDMPAQIEGTLYMMSEVDDEGASPEGEEMAKGYQT